jgi:hypothetical protein
MSRPHGFLVETLDNGTGKQIWQDSVQCCHCGKHLPWSPKRAGFGWCFKCNSWVCPGKSCVECVPYQKKLEKPYLYRPFRCHT